jgi:hypothetical protein
MELPSKKMFESQPSAGKLMLTFFGTHKAQFWNIIRRGTTINGARYSEMLISLQFKTNTKDCCGKVLCCCMTVPTHILIPTLMKLSENSSFMQWLVLSVVAVSPFLIITCLVH